MAKKPQKPSELPISEVELLKLRPGDVLVLKMPPDAPKEAGDWLGHALAQILPPGTKSLVIWDNTKISVLRPSEN